MGLHNIPARLITDNGIWQNGEFSDLTYLDSVEFEVRVTWENFLTRSGYNGGLFNLTWALDKPPGTYTQRITLKNGNYAVETVTITQSGSNYTTNADVTLYYSNDTQFTSILTLSEGVGGGRTDHLLVVVMYRDSDNHQINVQVRSNSAQPDRIYIDKSHRYASYSEFVGWLLGSIAPDDPYGLNENETPSGGYGDFDYTSEDETPPALPSLSAANAGFVTLWNPTISEVGDLADYLWGPTFSIASWQKLWNDPMECLLSLGIIPVAPTTGTRTNIYFGNADTGIESAPITTQFVTADMGSMHIRGQSASYMDYAPYAKASIYLPYCGTYALDVDEIMDADLALEYHIDIYTGACVAYLTINNRTNSDESNVHNVMYQFTGNCLASIPVTSGDHSQLLQSLLFMGAAIAATVATAGAASAGGAIEGLAAEGDVVASSGVLGAAAAGSAINTVMSMKPNVMHSGNLSSTAGLLGGQKPFVTFTWSNLCRPDDEYQLVGMPLQKSGTLSDFEGFTIVSACHMDNILCTDAERSMIEQALGRGVII